MDQIQKPSVGRVVLVVGPLHNGVTVHPAIVTRVWGPELTDYINTIMFPDAGAPVPITSIRHESAQGSGHFWKWPRRV